MPTDVLIQRANQNVYTRLCSLNEPRFHCLQINNMLNKRKCHVVILHINKVFCTLNVQIHHKITGFVHLFV